MSPAFPPSLALIAGCLSVPGPTLLPFLICLCGLCYLHYTRSPWRKLPPGPRGLPLLGNLGQLNDKRWLISPECKRAYGTLGSRLSSIISGL
jgi:hypothetical protein